MHLIRASVGPFKSIDNSGQVSIDPDVTVLVGMNEAGKTAFLQALTKANSVEPGLKFDPVEDYPRKNLTAYLKQHADEPAGAAVLTYRLDQEEVTAINAALLTKLPKDFSFTVTQRYNNTRAITISVDEKPVVAAVISAAKLSTDAATAAKGATSLRDLSHRLGDIERTPDDDQFKASLDARIAAAPAEWSSVVENEVWKKASAWIPKFLYFDDYYTLPGKTNLANLAERVAQEPQNPTALEPSHRAVLALLRMADIPLTDLTNPAGYETIKAKLEGISISITDQVFKFWKQNEQLEVEFDIRADAKETQAPFNNGANLYIRIKNKRHRVTVPFDKRSKGFIWFFSFLVWFDSVQQQAGETKNHDLILLLDEPGLSLHALAQADFLRYIDDLSTKHQVIYTTHSPFMVHADRLSQVRVVEDREGKGTQISENISGYDPKTLFPLQAALGYSMAQNLFISQRNVLIEGPSDLIYLRFFSSILEELRNVALRGEITLVPTGGLDKVATFVALFGANTLELGVLHDSAGKADARIASLVKQKMIPQESVLTYADFREVSSAKKGKGNALTPPSRIALKDNHPATDIEDLLDVGLYLELFNEAFASKLSGKKVKEGDLPKGTELSLASRNISLTRDSRFAKRADTTTIPWHPTWRLTLRKRSMI